MRKKRRIEGVLVVASRNAIFFVSNADPSLEIDTLLYYLL
jgi:hypothetical protein